MSGFNPSLTRLPPHWAASLEPSRLHKRIALVCGVLALMSIAGAGLPLWLTLATATLTTLLLIRLYRRLQHVRYLARLDDDEWLLVDESGRHAGTLNRCLYRTASLIILEITDQSGQRRSIPIWNDCLPAAEFSYLHCQLMKTPG